MNHRACIRTKGGMLRGASYAPFAGPGDSWIPVPPEAKELAELDAGRPTGVHPAIWYGWPRVKPDTRYYWTIEAPGWLAVVRAYSLSAALVAAGTTLRDATCVWQHAHWY